MRYAALAVFIYALLLMAFLSESNAQVRFPADTVKVGTEVTDSLQSLVDSIFAAQSVGSQIDSHAVSIVRDMAEHYRELGISDKFWHYRYASTKLDMLRLKDLPSISQPQPVVYKRHKLSI